MQDCFRRPARRLRTSLTVLGASDARGYRERHVMKRNLPLLMGLYPE
jgi:hypothetical protein